MRSRKTPPKTPAAVQPPPELRGGKLTLSFALFREREPFTLAAGGEGYASALFARLRDVCNMTPAALRADRSTALRYHPVRWADTTEPAGFDHVNPRTLAQIVPFQFAVSANKYGRVHGFWVEDTFYVVWLDPAHALYARPG